MKSFDTISLKSLQVSGPQKAVLTLSAQSAQPEAFHLLLPTTGSPKEVAALLNQYVFQTHVNLYRAGNVAAALIRAVSDAQLVTSTSAYRGTASYLYEVKTVHVMERYGSNGLAFAATAQVVRDGVVGTDVFGGTPNQFLLWAGNYLSVQALAGKVVAFHYRGGTVDGQRIVRVDSVTETHLKGTDVKKLEPRNYRLDSIDGDLAVVG